MVVQEPVQSAIWQCLNNYNFDDAIFLSERLYAEVDNDDTLFLLATCYFRSGKSQSALSVLSAKGCPTVRCRYLAAQCCLQLNKLAEAEAAICSHMSQKSKNFIDDVVNEFGEMACFALRLLAKVYSKTDNISRAVECFQRSLQLNPFLWSSYESLCHLGEKPDISRTFQMNTQTLSVICQTPVFSSPLFHSNNTTSETTMDMQVQESDSPFLSIYIDPATTPDQSASCVPMTAEVMQPAAKSMAIGGSWHTSSLLSGPLGLSPLTPSFGVMPLENTPASVHPYGVSVSVSSHMCVSPAVTGHFKARGVSNQMQSNLHTKPVFSQSGNTNAMVKETTTAFSNQMSNNNVGLRRSSRLFSHASGSSVKENNKNPNEISKLGLSPRAPTKKTKSKQQLSYTAQQLNDKNKGDVPSAAVNAHTQMALLQRQSADGLMLLLQELATAYQQLSQFNCRQAIEQFDLLPYKHRQTGWVLSQIGRAYFELSDYRKAEEIYSELRRLEPYRVEGLEIYSTVLWHLQSEMALSALTQDLTESEKFCPQAWCAAGNCFSLQKEHETAIRYFQRAVQVDPNFAYAYTLLGHEYVLIDELDKALGAFRNAIRIDPRHYNAWYGVGMVYHKQEKFVLAEFHFNKALTINPQSSALLCNIGVVQHALKKTDKALLTLDRAIAIDPRNPLCKFHRASVLFANDKHKEALQELEELKEIVPKESLVYFLIAKVHKKLGNTHLALINFSWATDLDPKGTNNHIKEALDKRYMVDDDDDDEMSNVSASDPVSDTTIDQLVDGLNRSSQMDADEFQLRATESDESL